MPFVDQIQRLLEDIDVEALQICKTLISSGSVFGLCIL